MKTLHTFISAFFLVVAPLLALAQNGTGGMPEQTISATTVPHISGGVGT